MRTSLVPAILLVTAVSVTGFSRQARAGDEPPAYEIRDYSVRYYFLGGSVLPPQQGFGWRSQRVGQNALNFGRSDSPQHTWAASVTPFYVDTTLSRDDLSELARLRAKEGQGKSVELRLFESTPDTTIAPTAMRYHYQIEDRNVPYDKGKLYVLEAHGLIYVHPQVPHLVAVIEFSERRRVEGEIPPGDNAKAQSFLAGLELLRYDATSLRHVYISGSAYVVRAGEDAVWAVTQPFDGKSKCDVILLDPTSLEIKQCVHVDGRIADLAVTRDGLWACDFEKGVVLRLDPVSLATTATIKTGGHPERLLAGFGALWASDQQKGTIQHIDLASAKTDGKAIKDLKQPLTMVEVGDAMWALDLETRRVMSVDPKTRKLAGGAIPADAGAGAMVFAEGSVWVLCGRSGKVMRLNPADLSVPAVVSLGFTMNVEKPTLMAFGGGELWVGDLDRGRLYRVDTGSNQVDPKFVGVGLDVGGMTVGDGVMWIADGVAGSIVEMPLSQH